jgi:hypothetical protein
MVRFNIKHPNLNGFVSKLGEHQISLLSPDESGVRLKVNPTINRQDPQQLASIFIKCLNQTN